MVLRIRFDSLWSASFKSTTKKSSCPSRKWPAKVDYKIIEAAKRYCVKRCTWSPQKKRCFWNSIFFCNQPQEDKPYSSSFFVVSFEIIKRHSRDSCLSNGFYSFLYGRLSIFITRKLQNLLCLKGRYFCKITIYIESKVFAGLSISGWLLCEQNLPTKVRRSRHVQP